MKGLIKARANARNIGDVLSERTGINFPTQSVRNLINRIKDDDEDGKTVEKVLGDIRDAGGDVMYRKESNTNNVDILWIQTKDMKNMLAKCRPLVFECDTTFNTQSEGYKLFIPTFHSNITDKWEIGGLLLLSTETKEKVEVGLDFFKSSLPYKIDDGVTKFIFFTDKDFDYIEVLTFYILFYLNVCMYLFSMFLHIALIEIIELTCIASQSILRMKSYVWLNLLVTKILISHKICIQMVLNFCVS